MKFLYIIFLNFFINISIIFSQSNIFVYYVELSNYQYEFYADSYAFCPYQILIKFKNTNEIISDKELPFYTIINPFEKNKFLLSITTKNSLSNNYTVITSIGDPENVNPDTNYIYILPFANGTKQKLTQGYNGRYSHRGWLKYSLDFGMKIGTEIYASRDGIVVDVKDDSSKSGRRKKYKKYANYITIYHNDGTFSQYVHLKKNGSLVNIGDYVKQGQLIGYSGNTGRVRGPHLHFMIYKPVYMGKMTIPVNFFDEDGKIIELKPKYFYTAYHNITNNNIINSNFLTIDLLINSNSNNINYEDHDNEVGDVE